jgi:putative transferase (TIGR04331 family)
LKEVGIFHETSESAARHVNNIWGDVGGWWKDEAVQNARMIFCEHYSKKSSSLIDDIARMLQQGSP